ncbi:MAG: extracellular solute-binding protein [Clostridia bacterium]|nr:extracellular solute-binding protein [Clostridia bacterium]
MKKLLSLLLVFGICLGLVACNKPGSNNSTQGGNTGDPIKLTIWCPEADHAFAKEVAKKYQQANPDKNYKFFYGIQGENDAATKVLNDVTNAPDVFSFASDQINKLISGDALARVGGSYLDNVKAANSADAVDSATVTINGEDCTYAMPYTDNTFFLYYDKTVLSEADVTSLDTIIAKSVEKGKVFAMPLNDGWYNSSFYFAENLGYSVTYDDALGEKSITCDFDSEVGQTVTSALWDYVKNPGVKADADDSKILAGFQDGSIAAAVTGIWNKNSILEYLGDNMGVAKLPTYTINRGTANEKQNQLVSFAGYKLMGVSNYSKNKAEAMKFAQFYTSEEMQLLHYQYRGFVPTNVNAKANKALEGDACAAAITAQLAYSKPQKSVPSTLWTPMQGVGDSMISKATYNEEYTLSELVELITNAVAQIETVPGATA